MKVRFKKTILVEVEKANLNEVWDRQMSRWDELEVESLDIQGKWANLVTTDGNVYLSVPTDAYEVISSL